MILICCALKIVGVWLPEKGSFSVERFCVEPKIIKAIKEGIIMYGEHLNRPNKIINVKVYLAFTE